MKRQLKLDQARLEDVAQVHNWVDTTCRQANLDSDTAFAVKLAVEEVFNNIVIHGYQGKGGLVALTIAVLPDAVTITLQDRAPRFSPDQAPKPNLGASLIERKIGGLGWHLVFQLMDQIQHTYADGNVLTMVKRIAHPP